MTIFPIYIKFIVKWKQLAREESTRADALSELPRHTCQLRQGSSERKYVVEW